MMLFSVTDFYLKKLLDDLASEYTQLAQEKGLGFSIRCDESYVSTDPILLEAIIRNLLSNAIRYTEHGHVEAQCTSDSSHVILRIIDTGVGIPVKQQENVFKEFYQVGNPERDRKKGLGLGLAIVHRITESHNGEIKVKSIFSHN